MAMAYAFRVLDQGARNIILQVNAVDAATTTAATADGTSNGILNANTLPLSTSTKIRRVLYNLTNNVVRIQWHASTNVDAVVLTGFGDWNLDYSRSGTQGMKNDGGAGVTGDIDLANFAVSTVTGGGGLVTATMSLVIFLVKGT